jgi:hypothetical protein
MSSSFRRGTTRRSSAATKQTRGEYFPKGSEARNQSVFERIGTKPWIGGLTLTSSGLREFDAILGGGQPLGTAMLIEEDRWTQDLALSLVRYWSAEAVAQQQTLSLVSTVSDIDTIDLDSSDDLDPIEAQQGMSPLGIRSFLGKLPRDQHLDKDRAKSAAMVKKIESAAASQAHVSSLQGFDTIEEGEDFDEEEAETSGTGADEGLTNAWQYKVSVQQERFGKPLQASSKNKNSASKVFCHSYDLSGKMEDQHDDNHLHDSVHIAMVDCGKQSLSCPKSIYQKCAQNINEKIQQHPNTVIRMLFLNSPAKSMAIALPLLLSFVRENSLPVVFLLTIRPWLRPMTRSASFASTSSPSYTASLTALRRSCDAVFSCEGFSALVTSPPPEFSDLAGILSIKKVALQALSHFSDTTTNRRPPSNRYGMKRDRRKMHIRMLHLPPEDFSADGSGAGTPEDAGHIPNKTALQPGMGCSSNRQSKSSSLEF